MRNEPASTPTLSSAAAAAALKARPTTPTNVAQVHSKRAARRSASVSSTGSRDRGRQQLHRTSSNGSMTERTFRSPSPGRNNAPEERDVPPVPSIPKQSYKTDTSGKPHKRATSLQTQPFRTASQRMEDGHAPWFGSPTAGDLSNVRRSDDVLRSPPIYDPRPSSPSSSINFSYPRSKHDSLGETLLSDYDGSEHQMVYDANSRRMVPRGELLMREHGARDSPEKPPRKKRQETKSTSYLNKGSVGRIRNTGSEKAPSEASTTSQTSSRMTATPKSKKIQPKPKPVPELTHLSREQTLVERTESDTEEPRIADLRKADGATVVAPSADFHDESVKELPTPIEEEPSEDDYDDRQTRQLAPPSRVTHVVDDVPVKPSSPPYVEPEKRPSSTEPASSFVRPPPGDRTKPPENRQHGDVRHARVHSESPHRTAHFAPTTDQLFVRHEPPPRSLSPRKSALKQRSPSRDYSASEDGSELSAAGFASNQDDIIAAKRKSARVSFDDQNPMVVGEAATRPETDSPVVSSPQTKKPWHSIMSRNKRDSTPLDEDEKMTPRPALPFFGSVREKKTRETEERPLIRPTDRPWSNQITTPPRQSSPDGKATEPIGQSNDFAVGSLLAEEQARRNEANTSRYREPLAPVVTSIDYSDVLSDSSSGSDDEADRTGRTVADERAIAKDPREPQNGSTVERNDFAQTQSLGADDIPTISIIHPSPRPQDEFQPDSPQDFFDVPGGFPNETPEDSEGSMTPPAHSITSEQERPAQSVSSKRPAPISTPRSMENIAVAPPSPLFHDIQEETEESDHSSIYSDAYEDLSDMEGDGFISLAAVVDSPVDVNLSNKIFEQAMAKSRDKMPSKENTPTKATFEEPTQTPKDWDNAKAYWKSLSSDKRRQLEVEAMEEEGDDADLDEVLKEKPKTKKRRSMDVRPPVEQPEREQQPRDSTRAYQIKPGTSWNEKDEESPRQPKTTSASTGGKLRKSMRGQDSAPPRTEPEVRSTTMRKSLRSGDAPAPRSEQTHFRKSLRAESEPEVSPSGGMRKFLRSNGSAKEPERLSARTSNARPASYNPPATKAAQQHVRNHSVDALASSKKPALKRQDSDDSESSFTRVRNGVAKSGGFGFRSSMRGSAPPAAPVSDAGRSSGRFSLRSLSPPASRFRRDSGPSSPPLTGFGSGMRTSLRAESDAGSHKRMSGFGRSSGKKNKKTASRFADSSDEEDVRPRLSSRFADSSDEDDVPSRKIKANGLPKTMRSSTASNSAAAMAMTKTPAQKEEEDSPDLPDSDDEIAPPKRGTTSNGTASLKNGSTTLKRSGSGRESLGARQQQTNGVDATPARPQHVRRGSILSILRRKKDPSDKISRNTKESAARRDTRLERNPEQLAVLRSDSYTSNTKLQKRAPSWPLPEGGREPDDDEETYVDEEKRPSTAGGPPASSSNAVNQGFMRRRSTSQLGPSDDVLAKEGKKKKFGTLRKMFGLHD